MTIHDTIARIKILMDKATPGRWSYDDEEGRVNAYVHYKVIGSPDFNDPCNSEFICCMRNAMPELITHIQRLENVAQAAREVSRMPDSCNMVSLLVDALTTLDGGANA